jgi:hypothetical protein
MDTPRRAELCQTATVVGPVPSIREVELRIRDLINEPRKKCLLMSKGRLWHQLCTSLDAIGDSQLAIDAFPLEVTKGNYGTLYLSIYGLLQACFLQQDAIRHLCEALNLEDSYRDHPQLLAIRELRNDAIGHPTKRNTKPPYRYCSISRVTMSSAGFQMLVDRETGESAFHYVLLSEVIADQRTYINELLSAILVKLEKELQEHKERFRMEKLADFFAQTGYAFEKLSQGVHDSSPSKGGHVGLWGLDHVRGVMTRFQDALVKRDLEANAYPGIAYLYNQVRYPIDQLVTFLEEKKAGQVTSIDERAAAIFVDFLCRKLEELHHMARKIDEDYES